MKSQYNLVELATELERRSEAKQDYIASTKSLKMTDEGILTLDGDEGFNVNDIAHEQIADRLGIPTKYYNRMRAETPDLLATNVNHWFNDKDENRLIRTLDGSARAFLSDKYQRIDNEHIASAVLPILLQGDQEVKIEAAAITEQKMYIRAIFPQITGEVGVGDVFQSGIAISNSEVGRGMVKIEPLVYRLVCKNGLTMPDRSFKARHVGSRIMNEDGIFEMLSDEAIRADDHAILLKVRDVVKASFDQTRFIQHLDMLRDAKDDRIHGDVVEGIKVLGKAKGFNEFEQSNILRHLIEGGDTSRYGVLNAVTRSAQDVGSYDRSYEIEAIGGEILVMEPKEWKAVAHAVKD